VRGYLLSPEANSDIIAIWRWIAKDSFELADPVDTELHDVFDALAGMPRVGDRREDLTPRPVLFFPLYSYLINPTLILSASWQSFVVHGM
jgi:plasmid stabilization system protein ParE